MHRSIISVAATIMIAMCAAPAAYASAATPTAAPITTQLPRNVVPSHYAVSLSPDAKAGTFVARTVITLDFKELSSSITLNAAGLAFSSATLLDEGTQSPVIASNIVLDTARQIATFTFAKPVGRGRHRLALEYAGKIGTQPVGLFSLDYDNKEGHQRALYTQFENSDARRVVPSWDEPNYKATFALDVTVPTSDMAVSNMPAASSIDLGDGRKRVTFATTPRMATYVLFFGLGQFERATAKVDDTEIGVVTQKGALSQAQFALESTKSVLAEYNDYFGVRYPLPKLDNVAAPGRSQFFGAMENWGGIFTFEYAMLLNPAISTQADKQSVFKTLAHEMAHQWFGDLVTMQWWDELWLNEGFASWMENRTTAKLHPEWNTAMSSVRVRESAMQLDAIATTHPVVQHIETVEQASSAFDFITYLKGESVIRMLEAYVGPDAWREGVRAYMKDHAYGNTVSDDLWKTVERAAGKPITAIAHDFTLQPGIPMISVGDAVCADGATTVTLTQGEFSQDQPQKAPLSWRVPVVVQTIGGATMRALLSDGKVTLHLDGCGPLLVNSGQSGYYRTLYAQRAFTELATAFGTLAPIDQLGLMSDAWSLGLAGEQDASSFLDLASGTPLDADTQIWSKIAGVFDAINDHYEADPTRQRKFASYAIARLAPKLAQLGWTARQGEPEPYAILRSSLIGTLSDLGDPLVIAEARRRYAARAEDPTAVPVALRKTILRVVARHADAATWDGLHAAARTETSQLIKDQFYDLLSSSIDPRLSKLALELALTDEPGATNSPQMILRVAALHPDQAFDFALAHLPEVNAKIDSTAVIRYFPSLAEGTADPAMLGKLDAYAKANLPEEARRNVDTAMASIRYRIKVRSERLPAIDTWLVAHQN
ncbi:M1 family metallopeptidase [Duganella aceris]|uniref:Aminopeptidase n=1 Tax=Duganella aceris TaxID=2703883 RepID=A0ABX0FKH8_9BURK|nr:M1 family metallopeptidase [Duganella aceris]NGZ85089.1 M1 family metallopeptidase [Duganella aceris]